MKLATTIIFTVLILFSIFYFAFDKLNFQYTNTPIKFQGEDINAVLEMSTTPVFEPIPNEEIETEFYKIDDLNYERFDKIKGTESGWVYEIKNNKMILKSQIKDRINHGKYWTFHQNGNMRSAGKYKEGKKEGLWIQFAEDGHQINYGKHKDGKAIGKWIYYDSLGYILEERIYDSLENKFSFERFDSTYNIVLDGYFLNDKRHGEWNSFLGNQNILHRSNYKNGLRHGKYEEWGENGNYAISYFKNGKEDGIAKFFTKDHELYLKVEFDMGTIVKKEEIPTKKK